MRLSQDGRLRSGVARDSHLFFHISHGTLDRNVDISVRSKQHWRINRYICKQCCHVNHPYPSRCYDPRSHLVIGHWLIDWVLLFCNAPFLKLWTNMQAVGRRAACVCERTNLWRIEQLFLLFFLDVHFSGRHDIFNALHMGGKYISGVRRTTTGNLFFWRVIFWSGSNYRALLEVINSVCISGENKHVNTFLS